MRHSLYCIVLLGILAGSLSACAPVLIDPARDQFGVSSARPDAGTAPAANPQLAELDRKARAICTTGYIADPPTIIPATSGSVPGGMPVGEIIQQQKPVVEIAQQQQLVAQMLRCGHYDRLTFDYLHVNWSNVF